MACADLPTSSYTEVWSSVRVQVHFARVASLARRQSTGWRACGVELPQRDIPTFAGTCKQQPRDEEARRKEEHVDADEAAPQEADPGVPQRDQEDGDGAKVLDVVPMSERRAFQASVS